MQIYLLVLSLLPISTLAVTCPFNGKYSDIFKGCIQVPLQDFPWDTCESYCQYMGGHLTVVDTAEKNDEYKTLSGQEINGFKVTFVGGFTSNGTYQWIGENPVNYTNFADPTTPYDDSAIVVMISDRKRDNSGLWRLVDKSGSFNFACTVPSCGTPKRQTLNTNKNYPGFIYSKNYNLWYAVSDEPQDQYEAGFRCQSMGGVLPIVQNAFQNVELVKIIKQADDQFPDFKSHNALGARSDGNGTWTWPNGQPLLYTNWAPNEPVYKINGEARIDTDTGLWYSEDFLASGYMCSFPAVNYGC